MPVNFKVTNKRELMLIKNIAMRAKKMADEFDPNNERDLLDWQMDITACHVNGCPLNLERLLKASDFNFAHDIGGIARHLNRDTGKLDAVHGYEGEFVPRFAHKGYRRGQAMRVITDLKIAYAHEPGGRTKKVLKASYVEVSELLLEPCLKGEGEFTVCEIPPKQYDDCE